MRRGLVAALTTAALTVTLVATTAASTRAALTTTSAGVGTGLLDVDMVTPTLGFGVAGATPPHGGALDVVRTADAGHHWTVVA
ncbi:MAG: hypothetical protein ACRDV0_02605, partial [Acidimicrobiales bacterium]